MRVRIRQALELALSTERETALKQARECAAVAESATRKAQGSVAGAKADLDNAMLAAKMKVSPYRPIVLHLPPSRDGRSKIVTEVTWR